MALSISKLNSYQNWTATSPVDPIVLGSGVTNTAGAKGMIVSTARSFFGLGPVNRVKFIIYSGTFTTGETLTTADGGTFVIGTNTATTEETIIVEGEMPTTNITTVADDIDSSKTRLLVASASINNVSQFIEIDSERMLILASFVNTASSGTFTVNIANDPTWLLKTAHGIKDGSVCYLTTTGTLPAPLSTSTLYYVNSLSPNIFGVSETYLGPSIEMTDTGSGTHTVIPYSSYDVQRGVLASTPASHTSTTNVDQFDTDLFQKLYDEDVAQGWGLITDADGKFKLDCHLFRGSYDQSAQTLLISSLENFEFVYSATVNNCYGCGNTTYRTYDIEGRGYMDSGTRVFTGFNTGGSVGKYNTFTNYEGHSYECYGSVIDAFLLNLVGAAILKEVNIFGQLYIAMTEASKMYRVTINRGASNFISSVTDISQLQINYGTPPIYFVHSSGDAEIWELTVTEGFDNFNAFIVSGTKTMINCKFVLNSVYAFGASTLSVNKKTVDCNVKDPSGNPIENVQLKLDYVTEATGNAFTVLTDSDGDIAQQQVEFARFLEADGSTYKRYWRITVSKSGYKTQVINRYVSFMDDPICLAIDLVPNRYIEQKSK